MGVLDAPMGRASVALIARFGKLVTLRTPAGVYSVETGGVSGDPVDLAVRAQMEAYPAVQTMGGSVEGSDGVQRGDMKVTLAAKSVPVKPETTQQVVIDGDVYGIVKADPIYSGDEAALYVLQCRR